MKWKIPWRDLFDALPKDCNLDPFADLMKLPIKPVPDCMEKESIAQEDIFGYLPIMCKSSPCQLDVLYAQSFTVRIILAGNLLITKKRTLMDNKPINKLIVLRMSKIFMESMRRNGKANLYHQKGISED